MPPLLRASHAPPTAVVTSIALALAVGAGRGRDAVWVALAVLAGQLSVGWSNDYLDRERDRVAARSDKPIVTGEVTSRAVGAAAVVAAAACVPLSLVASGAGGVVHIGAVAVAWAYNARLKRTLFSPLPYAAAFGSLPVFVTLGLPGAPMPPWWAPTAAALLGVGAHFVNTLPDLDDDIGVGVLGMPQRLGARRAVVAAGVLLGAAMACAAMGPGTAGGRLTAAVLGGTLVAVSGIVVLAWRGRSRLAWLATLALASLTVGLLVWRGARLEAGGAPATVAGSGRAPASSRPAPERWRRGTP